MSNVTTYLETLARETQRPEAEVIAQAVETGLRQLWRERVLGLYLRGHLSRQEAIESVGIDWVELTERQQAAAREDFTWGLKQ